MRSRKTRAQGYIGRANSQPTERRLGECSVKDRTCVPPGFWEFVESENYHRSVWPGHVLFIPRGVKQLSCHAKSDRIILLSPLVAIERLEVVHMHSAFGHVPDSTPPSQLLTFSCVLAALVHATNTAIRCCALTTHPWHCTSPHSPPAVRFVEMSVNIPACGMVPASKFRLSVRQVAQAGGGLSKPPSSWRHGPSANQTRLAIGLLTLIPRLHCAAKSATEWWPLTRVYILLRSRRQAMRCHRYMPEPNVHARRLRAEAVFDYAEKDKHETMTISFVPGLSCWLQDW